MAQAAKLGLIHNMLIDSISCKETPPLQAERLFEWFDSRSDSGTVQLTLDTVSIFLCVFFAGCLILFMVNLPSEEAAVSACLKHSLKNLDGKDMILLPSKPGFGLRCRISAGGQFGWGDRVNRPLKKWQTTKERKATKSHQKESKNHQKAANKHKKTILIVFTHGKPIV